MILNEKMMPMMLNALTEKEGGRISPLITNREKEVLEGLAKGLTVKEIAFQMNVSSHTIISHKKNLLKKLDAKNAVESVVKAIKYRIILI